MIKGRPALGEVLFPRAAAQLIDSQVINIQFEASFCLLDDIV